jgi:hypothetical protein
MRSLFRTRGHRCHWNLVDRIGCRGDGLLAARRSCASGRRFDQRHSDCQSARTGPYGSAFGTRAAGVVVRWRRPQRLGGWLGYADPAETFKKTHSVNPIGAGGVGRDYMVVVVDGEPAIYVNGKTFGSLTHKADCADYHLSLQFKWGESTYYPKLSDPKDSGVLYHSHGAPGGVSGTWMRSVEFDIVHGRFGSLATVGDGLSSKTVVGRDADLLSPRRRYMVGVVKLVSRLACRGLRRALPIRKTVRQLEYA